MKILASTLVGLLATGCSMSSFDEQRSKAWSDSNGADGISSTNYGVQIAGVTTEQLGATIAVLGTEPLGLGIIRYDETGALSLLGADLAIPGIPEITPTMIAAPEPLPGANGLVAIGGLGDDDTILFYDVSDGPPREVATLDGSECGGAAGGGKNLGYRMAFAFTAAGVDNMIDLVALRGNQIFLYSDLDLASDTHLCHSCALAEGSGASDLAIFELGDDDGEDMLVSLDGALTAFDSFQIEEASDANVGCFDLRTPQISNLTAPGEESDFGARLAVGDGSDDDSFDIAASAPSSNLVYVIPNLTGSGPGGLLQPLAAPVASGAFGSGPMIFADLDNRDGDELIIGDPAASPEGVRGAGQASIFTFSDDEEFESRGVIYDNSPDEGQAYGRALSVSEFVFGMDDADLLVVGALDEAFTIFRTLRESRDPRVGIGNGPPPP